MTEGEPKSKRMTEFFSRIMHPEGKPKFDAAKKENAVSTEEIRKKKKEAKEFAEKQRKQGHHVSKDTDVKDGNRYVFEENALQQEKNKLEASLKASRNKPTWLITDASDIMHSAAAAAYASRIASLSVELQKDPNVLYQEAAYLSASMKMFDAPQVNQEINLFLKKTINQITTLRAENLGNNFSLKHNELQQTLLFEFGSGSVKTQPYIYDAAVDLPLMPHESQERKNLRVYLTSVQNQLNDTSKLFSLDSERELEYLQKFEKDLISGCDDYIDPVTHKKVNKAYDRVEAQEFLTRLHAREDLLVDDIKTLREAAYERRDRERGFSTISLSPEIMDAMMEDDAWAIEENIRVMEKSAFYPNTPSAKAKERELDKMSEYFTNQQYLTDIRKYLETSPQFVGKTPTELDALFNERKARIIKLSEEIHLRVTEQIIFGQIRTEGDTKKISSSLLQLGTHGIGHLQAGNAGLNEIVGNRMVQRTREARWQLDTKDNKVKETAFTAETMRQIRVDMREEIKQNKALYELRYGNKAKGGWEGKPLDDDAIDSIVHQAEMLLTIEQRDLVAILEAPGPASRRAMGDDVTGSSSFESFSTAEKFLAAMDVGKYGFDKWNKLTSYPRKMWRNACEFAAKASGRDKSVVDEMLKGVKQGDSRFIELAEQAFGSKETMEKMIKLERRAESILDPKGLLKGGLIRKIIPDIPEEFKDLSMDDLRKQMVIKEGERIVTELLEVYDNFSSGWRIKEYVKQLERMYGKNNEDSHLGLGMKLREAGYGLVHLESKEHRPKAEEKVRARLVEIAKYRPQAIFEWLSGRQDVEAKAWFVSLKPELTKAKLGGINADITHESQLCEFVSQRFNLINDFLADEGLGPIDYSGKSGISAEQMTVVKEVCESTRTNVDAYMEIMKKTSEFALPINPDKSTDLTQINKLLGKKYYDIYTRTRWVDDVRMRYLENPDNAPGSLTAEKFKKDGIKNARLSDLFVEAGDQGMGGGDQLPRSWNDMGVGMEASNLLMDLLTTNAKQFTETLAKVYKMVGQYSGFDPTAARTVVYMMAAYGKTCKTDDLLDFMMLGKKIEGSSQAQRLLNGEAPSLAKGEMLKLEEQIEVNVILDQIEAIAPDLAREAEVFMGVRFPGPGKYLPGEIGRHAPVWLHRAEIVAIVAGLLILGQAGKIAQEEASGGKKH